MIAPARAAALAVVAAALTAASCGAPRVKLPSGDGVAASDLAAVMASATNGCRDLRTLSAEVRVAGRVRGRRIRGRLSAGFAAPGSVRIEAVAPFGPPVFILVSVDREASLLLPRDRRVVHDVPADQLLDALVGIRLTPAGLWQAVTACPEAQSTAGGRSFGDDWRRVEVPPDERLYFHRVAGVWRLVSDLHQRGDAARVVEYLQYQGNLPTRIHLSGGGPERAAAYEIALDLSQLEPNVELAPEVFEIAVPPGAQPMTLDELRRTGPLAAPGGSRE